MPNCRQLSALILGLLTTFSWGYQPENKPDNAWSALKTPAQGTPEAIGSYANGCMIGASSLPAADTGFVDMRRNRNRFYGQPRLIRFIRELGQFTYERHGQKHLIGDLSQPRGGRMNFGHSSHQTGLDVDIWMQTVPNNQAVNPTVVDKAAGTVNGGALPLPTRDALYFSATHPAVARIFVNPVVKWHLCLSETDTSWLHKLRPWWGHDQHFHVRLRCADDQPLCKNQDPPPPGDGCDASLYNWVDEQSGLVTGRIKPKKRTNKKRKPKVLPERCVLIQRP